MAKKVTEKEFNWGPVLSQNEKWLGKNEADKSHREIIDAYNDIVPLPRGYKVKYSDAWCAPYISAVFHVLGYDEFFPLECSCYYMVEKAKEMGIWVENDSYVPQLGDVVFYDWEDTGIGDNKGTPDHVGFVTEVNKGYGNFVVTEGNYKDSVKKRTLNFNSRYIRGFIVPKYTGSGEITNISKSDKSVDTLAREVIAGSWGSGSERKKLLEKAGYSYSEVQKKVNEILNNPSVVTITLGNLNKKVMTDVKPRSINSSLKGQYKTTADLYLREAPGKNKKAMVVMPKGTVITNYGYYTNFNYSDWLYVETTVEGVKYTGFCHSKYLKKL